MSKVPPKAKAKPSKDTKGKTASTEKQPATLFEIVPGKFNENDWNLMLEIDDSQEFVWEIIDEVFDSTIKIIYDRYLEKQAIPYTISKAHEAILHIIDWQFLTKDQNDDLTENWVQDQEPDACVIDSWAQGYVQAVSIENEFKRNKRGSDTNLSEKDENHYFLEELNRIIDQPNSSKEPTDLSKQSINISPLKFEEPLETSQIIKLDQQKPRIIPIKTYKKKSELLPLTSFRASIEEEIAPPKPIVRVKAVPEIKKLEEQINKAPVACQSLLKTLLSRPINMREIGIDTFGNVETISKLEFDKSAISNIKARFTIMAESKYNITNSKNKNVVNTSIDITDDNLSAQKVVRRRKSPPRRKSKNIQVEEENDIMLEPAAGVSVTINNSTRVGPKKINITNKQQLILEKSEHFLQPVKQITKTEISSSSMQKILGNPNTKSVKQTLNQFKPIPPINNSTSVN